MLNLGQWNFVKEITFTKPKTRNRHFMLNIRLELLCVSRVVLTVWFFVLRFFMSVCHGNALKSDHVCYVCNIFLFTISTTHFQIVTYITADINVSVLS